MRKLDFLFHLIAPKKKPAKTIDEYKDRILKNDKDAIIENNEVIVGGILEGRAPEFIDATPNHVYQTLNHEFDMLP